LVAITGRIFIKKSIMIKFEILGFGLVEFEHFVTDFSGALSEDGMPLPEVKEKLNEPPRRRDGGVSRKTLHQRWHL
jgi:hypothetical protein